jgi:hypothetical protein
MYTGDPTELPVMWRARSDKPSADFALGVGRAATMLKGYEFKTAALMHDLLWDEVKKGNLRPLIPFLLLEPLAGHVIIGLTALATLNFKTFRELLDPVHLLKAYVRDLSHQFGLSWVAGLFDAVANHKSYTGSIIEEQIFGSAIHDGIDTVALPFGVASAKTPKAKEKVIEHYLENTVAPVRTAERALGMDKSAGAGRYTPTKRYTITPPPQ